jgi:hypothetical protein
MPRLYGWWLSSASSKTPILIFIASVGVTLFVTAYKYMIYAIYTRTLEKLEAAKERLNKRIDKSAPKEIIRNGDMNFAEYFPLQVLAKEAKVWLWLARRAVNRERRIKKYGSFWGTFGT